MAVRTSIAAPMTISPDRARAFLLRRPGGLYASGGLPDHPLPLVRQIGILQVDPVSVVAANHHLIARTRVPGYQTAHLDDALYRDRSLVENFHSIHAILPMEDWRFYDRRLGPPTRMEEAHPEIMRQATERVLGVIRECGPRAARDFMDEDDRTPMEYGWGTTRRSQVALQTLLRRGFLIVHHREGTQRFYELTERMLPLAVDATPVTEAERALHFAQRDLTYAGLAMGTGGIQPAIAAGDAVPVTIEGLRAIFYLTLAHREQLASVIPVTEAERRAVILAPLDPFVWDRKRLAALWDFDYRWEVYVPAEKRKYGPYTLPVLWGDRFVARLDPSLDRKRRVLRIKNLWFEDDAPRDPALFTDLAAEIARFAVFHGDAAVALGTVYPVTRDKRLRAALARITTLAAIESD
ncbi:MAG: winged helix DNA-binding domain-containing protein [Chloroflexota bacterium]|nr:winged helix DNA-binding domain-containing protein [Chloroflexota bacterium]